MVTELTGTGANLKDKKPDIDLKQSHWLRGDLETSTTSHFPPSGKYEWAMSQVKTLKDDDHSPILVILSDVSRRKQLEAQLQTSPENGSRGHSGRWGCS